MKDAVGQVIVWADAHHPYADVRAQNTICKFAKHIQPDFHIFIGDCLDLNGISRHTYDDFIAQYEDPVQAGLTSFGNLINHLQKITPNAKIVWIFGNHDDRLRKFAKRFPAWRGIVDKPLKLLQAFGGCLGADKIKVVYLEDFTDDFKIGKMHFNHGHYTCKHTAAKHVEAYDESVTYGHAHTMQMFTMIKRDKPRAAYCVGHLMDKRGRKYLKGAPTRWVTGFGFMEYLKKSGRYTMHLLPIVKNGFMYGGRHWN